MISVEAQYLIAAPIAATLGWLITQHVRARFAKKPEPERLDLGDPETRKRMEKLLAVHQITGNADIRDGAVLKPVTQTDMHPVLHTLSRATGMLCSLRNPAACSLYVRDSVSDRWLLLPIDLDDLQTIERLLRNVAGKRN